MNKTAKKNPKPAGNSETLFIRMPPDLMAKLKAQAERQARPVSAMARLLIAAGCEQ